MGNGLPGFTLRTSRIFSIVLWAGLLLAAPALAVEDNSFTNALRGILERAEDGLAAGEAQLAESHYRLAVLETWMQLAMLEVAAGDWPAARDALVESTRSAATGERRTRSSLALVQLWLDETDEALQLLRDLTAKHPKNTQVRQLFVQALLATDRLEEAGQQLEELRPRAPQAVERIEQHVARFELQEQAMGEKADWPARRKAFLPVLGGGAFEGLAAAELEAETSRLRATQVRIRRPCWRGAGQRRAPGAPLSPRCRVSLSLRRGGGGRWRPELCARGAREDARDRPGDGRWPPPALDRLRPAPGHGMPGASSRALPPDARAALVAGRELKR